MTDAPATRQPHIHQWIGPMREISPGRFRVTSWTAWTEEIETAEQAATSMIAIIHYLNAVLAGVGDGKAEVIKTVAYSEEVGDSSCSLPDIRFRDEKLSVSVRQKTRTSASILSAAMAAREAAIEGDQEVVDAFAAAWMQPPKAGSEQWRSALVQALIADWTSALTTGSAEEKVTALLAVETRVAHRQLQPLWERKAAGHRLHLLDKPIDCGLTLRDLVTDHSTPEEAILRTVVDHVDLNAVLRSLTPVERKIAQIWAICPGSSWKEAAELAGVLEDPEALGARVMRKLKRLGNRHTQRRTSAKATVAQSETVEVDHQ